MKVNVEIQGLAELQAALKKYPQIAEPILQRAVEAGGFEVQKRATRGALPWKTGFLTQSFGLKPIIGRLMATIAPTAYYAIFVHEGTRPHVITAKKGGGLYWPGAKHPVKSVNHPGTKPNRFMPKIAKSAESAINKHFERALELITEAIARKAS